MTFVLHIFEHAEHWCITGNALVSKCCPLIFLHWAISGANVNATTATGDTPLSFACENGHTDVADVLLSAGADLVRNYLGYFRWILSWYVGDRILMNLRINFTLFFYLIFFFYRNMSLKLAVHLS